MVKSKKYKFAHKIKESKGIIFTIEATLTISLLAYLVMIVNLNYTRENNIDKLLFLQDVYEILESKHSDFAFFVKSGIINDNLKNLINEIESVSGKNFSIKLENGFQTRKCNGFSMERAVMTTDGPRKITLTYCQGSSVG